MHRRCLTLALYGMMAATLGCSQQLPSAPAASVQSAPTIGDHLTMTGSDRQIQQTRRRFSRRRFSARRFTDRRRVRFFEDGQYYWPYQLVGDYYVPYEDYYYPYTWVGGEYVPYYGGTYSRFTGRRTLPRTIRRTGRRRVTGRRGGTMGRRGGVLGRRL